MLDLYIFHLGTCISGMSYDDLIDVFLFISGNIVQTPSKDIKFPSFFPFPLHLCLVNKFFLITLSFNLYAHSTFFLSSENFFLIHFNRFNE